MGIVNGTTNFILTKMSQNGAAYDEVLKQAQELGFAEADPTSDVEGLDAARKMVILATLGFSMEMALDDVSVQGISGVTEEDIQYGKQLGYTMKLIGIAQQDGEKVEVSVGPTFLADTHPLASVHNEYNAVYVCGEAVGETVLWSWCRKFTDSHFHCFRLSCCHEKYAIRCQWKGKHSSAISKTIKTIG